MKIEEREELKIDILGDLQMLERNSWDIHVKKQIQDVIDKLESVRLEAYDD